jgi:hypothetical protein
MVDTESVEFTRELEAFKVETLIVEILEFTPVTV